MNKKIWNNEITKEFLEKEYLINKKPYYKIAIENNCCVLVVKKHLLRFNIPMRSLSESEMKYQNVLTFDFLKDEYVDKFNSASFISRRVGVSVNTVLHYLRKYNIKIRKPGSEILGIKNNKYIDGRSLFTSSLRNLNKYKKWRTEVFKRDNYTCQECGKTKCYLEAHHKITVSKIIEKYKIKSIKELLKCSLMWKINNGVTLCKSCHNKAHPEKGFIKEGKK